VQVACVFLQTTALMIQKAPMQNSSTNQQQKLWPLASSALKSASGKSLNLGRAGKPCQSCSWTGFVYFSQIQNRELILGKGGAQT
jgi:hypothetical protein